jgi:hypothetical protein
MYVVTMVIIITQILNYNYSFINFSNKFRFYLCIPELEVTWSCPCSEETEVSVVMDSAQQNDSIIFIFQKYD